MTRTGRWIRATAQRCCSPRTVETLVDPMLADLQHELSRSASGWPRVRCLVVGYAAMARAAAALGGLAVWDAGVRGITPSDLSWAPSMVWAVVTGAAAAALFMSISFLGVADVPPNVSRLSLLLSLVPQAVPALPVAFACGFAFGTVERLRHWPSRRIVVAVGVLACVVTALTVDRVLADANQHFRVLVAGRDVLRGPTELRLSELWGLLAPGHRAEAGLLQAAGPHDPPLAFWFHGRVALVLSPLVVAILVVSAARLSVVASRVLVLIGAASFTACYSVVPPLVIDDIIRQGVSPVVMAWTPNMILIAIAALSLGLRSAGPRSSAPDTP